MNMYLLKNIKYNQTFKSYLFSHHKIYIDHILIIIILLLHEPKL
jgi:hypothetical protein